MKVEMIHAGNIRDAGRARRAAAVKNVGKLISFGTAIIVLIVVVSAGIGTVLDWLLGAP